MASVGERAERREDDPGGSCIVFIQKKWPHFVAMVGYESVVDFTRPDAIGLALRIRGWFKTHPALNAVPLFLRE